MANLDSSSLRPEHEEILRWAESKAEKLIEEFTPGHSLSPFHQFPGPIGEQEKQELWNRLTAVFRARGQGRARKLVAFDAKRGMAPTKNHEIQARQWADFKLEKLRP